jgi:hypothetical protein
VLLFHAFGFRVLFHFKVVLVQLVVRGPTFRSSKGKVSKIVKRDLLRWEKQRGSNPQLLKSSNCLEKEGGVGLMKTNSIYFIILTRPILIVQMVPGPWKNEMRPD